MASTPNSRQRNATNERPEFAAVLGLLPPYSSEDVKRAYLDKVKAAHPDRGGDRADFDRLQEAHTQAQEYLKFRTDRRKWIAKQMDEYVAMNALMQRLRDLGAELDTRTHDWLKRSFGDFADLTEAVVEIRLNDSPNVGALVDTLVSEQTILAGLKCLNLAGCPVTDQIALELRVFPGLTHLDLSRTSITDRALAIVDWLPELRELKIDGTGIGWLARRRHDRTLHRRRRERPGAVFHPANIR